MEVRFLVATAIAAVALAACGDPSPVTTGAPKESETPATTERDASGHEDIDGPEAPPPVTVRFDGESIELQPWT